MPVFIHSFKITPVHYSQCIRSDLNSRWVPGFLPPSSRWEEAPPTAYFQAHRRAGIVPPRQQDCVAFFGQRNVSRGQVCPFHIGHFKSHSSTPLVHHSNHCEPSRRRCPSCPGSPAEDGVEQSICPCQSRWTCDMRKK